MMKEKHIIDILENSPLASLSESELNTIRAHAETLLMGRAQGAAANDYRPVRPLRARSEIVAPAP